MTLYNSIFHKRTDTTQTFYHNSNMDPNHDEIFKQILMYRANHPESFELNMIRNPEDLLVLWSWLVRDLKVGSAPYKFIFTLIMCSELASTKSQVLGQWVLDNTTQGEQSKCICGHSIKNVFWYRNLYNGNIVATGRACLEKFISGSLNLTLNTKRACKICGKKRIKADAEVWRTQCKKCFRNTDVVVEVEYRSCSKCKCKVIKECEPKFIKLCMKCYRG